MQLTNDQIERFMAMIDNANTLAMQVQEERADLGLAEEVLGETSEFMSLFQQDWGSIGDADCVDTDLAAVANLFVGLANDAAREHADFLHRMDTEQSL